MADRNESKHRFGACLVLAAVVLLFPPAAPAQDSWEGNAAMIRRGEFESTGLFAASNAFPVSSRVQVTNLQTGKQVEVTIARRIDGPGTIFLLLSERAALELGVSQSEVARVRARLVVSSQAQAREPTADSPYTADPDFNPAASVDESLIASPAEADKPAPTAPPAPVAPPAPAAAEAVVQAPAETATRAPAASPSEAVAEAPARAPAEERTPVGPGTPTPTAGREAAPAAPAPAASEQPQPSAEERRLKRLSERLPQKQLFLPPRQTLLPSEPPPQVAVAPETETPTEEPAEAAEIGEEPAGIEQEPASETAAAPVEEQPAEQPPAVSMTAPAGGEQPEDEPVDLPGPTPTLEPSAEGTRLASPEEQTPLGEEIEEMPIATVAEEQPPPPEEQVPPPEEVAAVEAPPGPELAAEPQPAVEAAAAGTASSTLPRRSYFVQVGAYSTQGLADKMASQLRERYEVVVLAADSRGRLFYKVLVGPLNRDESGTLLYQFRARGFKDAFVQYVE